MKTLITTLALLASVVAYAAEPEKSLQELIQERQKLYAEIEAYKKESEMNAQAFNKLPAVAELQAKQKTVGEKWQKAQGMLNEINEKIAAKVSKDKK